VSHPFFFVWPSKRLDPQKLVLFQPLFAETTSIQSLFLYLPLPLKISYSKNQAALIYCLSLQAKRERGTHPWINSRNKRGQRLQRGFEGWREKTKAFLVAHKKSPTGMPGKPLTRHGLPKERENCELDP